MFKNQEEFKVQNLEPIDYSYHNAYPDLKNKWAPSAKTRSYFLRISLIFIPIGGILSQLYIHYSLPEINPPVFTIEEPRIERLIITGKEDFINYASLTNGATVIHDNKEMLKALSSDNSPGNCFKFKGNHYLIPIKLKYLIKPTSFSIYHINALNYHESPRRFRVYDLNRNGNHTLLIGDYEYLNHATDKKTFQVFSCQDCSEMIEEIAFEIISNHGLPYTCIYELGVHGILL